MMRDTKGRTLLLCYGMGIVFSIFSFRLVDLQLVKHEIYSEKAARKHINKTIIHARRGFIRDAHGEVLAENTPVRNVVADASHINDAEAVATQLATALKLDRREIVAKLAGGRRYIVLARGVPELTAEDLRQSLASHGLRGIYFEEASARIYPNGRMLSHVIGFTNHEFTGVEGIERTIDGLLRGEDGYRYIERDRTGAEIVPYRGQERAPRDGCEVTLTVDMGLQHIVENELDAVVKQYRPESATVILMRPQTGEILALANRPDFDPNNVDPARTEEMKNRAIINLVEPGSTFKIVTVSGALNERLVTPATTIFCENGKFRFSGTMLRDHHPYGALCVSDILVKSSNVGAAKLGIQMGDDRLYEYVRRFGFGEPTGIELPGEIRGIAHPPQKWSRISVTRIPMGHEVGVTPIQLVTAMGAIANGGQLMKPRIVRSVTDGDGRVVARYGPQVVRRVVSREVAAAVDLALRDVVSDRGTASLARVGNFAVAGKTGTAEKVSPNGGYMEGKYVVSFLGYMPADNPAFVGLVMIDNPKTGPGLCYGGLVAAPVFATIAEKAARYLDLEPPPPPAPADVAITSISP